MTPNSAEERVALFGTEQPKRIWLQGDEHSGEISWTTEPTTDDADFQRVEYVRADLTRTDNDVSGLVEALEELADLASKFGVSGVYFDEEPRGKLALERAFAAISRYRGETVNDCRVTESAVELAAQAIYETAQAENGNLSALPWHIVAVGNTAERWRTYARAARARARGEEVAK